MEVLRILKPLGVEAAIKALDTQAGETSAAQATAGVALAQARFEATHAAGNTTPSIPPIV